MAFGGFLSPRGLPTSVSTQLPTFPTTGGVAPRVQNRTECPWSRVRVAPDTEFAAPERPLDIERTGPLCGKPAMAHFTGNDHRWGLPSKHRRGKKTSYPVGATCGILLQSIPRNGFELGRNSELFPISERTDGPVDDREAGFRVEVGSVWRGLLDLAGVLQGASQHRITWDGLGRLGRIHAYTTRMYMYLLLSLIPEG